MSSTMPSNSTSAPYFIALVWRRGVEACVQAAGIAILRTTQGVSSTPSTLTPVPIGGSVGSEFNRAIAARASQLAQPLVPRSTNVEPDVVVVRPVTEVREVVRQKLRNGSREHKMMAMRELCASSPSTAKLSAERDDRQGVKLMRRFPYGFKNTIAAVSLRVIAGGVCAATGLAVTGSEPSIKTSVDRTHKSDRLPQAAMRYQSPNNSSSTETATRSRKRS